MKAAGAATVALTGFTGVGAASSKDDKMSKNKKDGRKKGKSKGKSNSARKYAPGQKKKKGESARKYAPGQKKKSSKK